jgi:hypothetical protein
MNRVRIRDNSISWAMIGGMAVRTEFISGLRDTGADIVVYVVGKRFPICISYEEAQKVFAGWDSIAIVPSKRRKKIK